VSDCEHIERSSLVGVVFAECRAEVRRAARIRWGAAALPALAVTVTVIAVASLGVVDPNVLCVLPLLALSLLLALRRYPGEEVMARLSGARRRPLRGPRRLSGPNRPDIALLPRGGRLLGCALAVRPPPGARLAES
jgi:hypothetical protein